MLLSRMLWIGTDAPMIEAVRGSINALGDLELVVRDGVRDLDRSWRDLDAVALVVAHLTRSSEVSDLIVFLHTHEVRRRRIPVVALSNLGRPEDASLLYRAGLAEYLALPAPHSLVHELIDRLTYPTRSLIEAHRTAAQEEPVETPAPVSLPGLPAALLDQVRLVASQDASILLEGETGTGKTRLARLIHECSRRRDEPFLSINCNASLPDQIESEMFGASYLGGIHANGNGHSTARGKFADAGAGTILLDEIDSLSAPLQAKLLRVVEDREFEPSLGTGMLPLRARLIAASNRPLAAEVAAGRFRADLYYRLNVIEFRIPPLRERPGAVSELTLAFLDELAHVRGRSQLSIEPGALERLEKHDWPGNVRELRNVLERASTFNQDGVIQLTDLPESVLIRRNSGVSQGTTINLEAEEMERRSLNQARQRAECARIIQALREHQNNRSRTARMLGISRVTLYKKLQQYGLTDWPNGHVESPADLEYA